MARTPGGVMELLGLTFGLIGLALLVAVLAGPFVLLHLARRIRTLETRLARAEAALARTAAPPEPQATAPESPTPPEPPEPAPAAAPAPGGPWRATRPASPEPAAEAAPQPPRPSRLHGLEEAFTARWMVWLGGLAIALSAIFLFRFAIEQGWLGPATRTGLGLLLGVALVLAGGWLHRRPPAGLPGRLPPDQAGPALTAAGIFALYASFYAAQGLYGLLGPAIGFAALAAVSALALTLARSQGWFVALLGIAGGYLIPALIRGEAADPAPVFLYLLALTLGGLALISVRPWWFLTAAVLIGALFWPLAWLAGPYADADQGVLSAYLLGIAGLFGLLGAPLPWGRNLRPPLAWAAPLLTHTAGPGFIGAGALLVLLADASGWNPPAFVFLGLYALAGLALGLRHGLLEPLVLVAALVVAAAAILWPQPYTVLPPAELERLGTAAYADAYGPFLLPPEFVTYARALAGFGLLFGLGGFAALLRAPSPGVWSGLSAGMPLFLLALAYARIGAFEIDLGWSLIAAGLALAFVGAAVIVPRLLGPGVRDLPMGLYAAGSTAALALAFACLMREAWLTIALALQVAALAWILTRLPLRPLRLIAVAAIAVVIVRLVLNPALLAYDDRLVGPFAWVIYGYGLPAAAFLLAARLLRRTARTPDAALADLAETTAVAFLFLMVALQLRIWTAGSLAAPGYRLFDMGVQSLWWLIAALLLLRPATVARLPAARWGGLGLMALASAQLLFGHLVAANPLATGEPVGTLPLANLIGLAYLAPALLLGLLAWSAGPYLPPPLRMVPAALAGLLAFAAISLETRRAFRGPVIELAPGTYPTAAELYAYSAVWIGFALVLLGIGIWRASAFWRALSLAVLAAAVLKIFLYDLSDLTGLWRVASFLGLGLSLIAIGQLYRRFVFARPPT